MISRRRFLRTTASAGIVTAATGTAFAVEASAAAPVTPDAALTDHLNGILANLLTELREERRLSKAHKVAEASLAAWARPGPIHLLHNGTKGGPEQGWPEIADLPEPPANPGTHKVIRPNPYDLWHEVRRALKPAMDFTRHANGSFSFTAPKPLSPHERREIQRREFARMRMVLARRREQLALEKATGITDIEAAMEAQADRVEVQRERLEEAAATGASPAALAATALVEAMGDADEFVMLVLARTAPHLTGLLHIVVDDFVAKKETEGYYATILGTGDTGGLV
ncbi:hypothetical protein [Aureimonas leprariae]|uniref:Tat (Twin-arginine translocation) pathway signal sequence n=1 Tax=Plantimonas leprariae TaxID=2615207 RepID=A0A7V7TZ96_9HYPH|nr:hypothetical protein [Aureimonas leprariae]KAB0679049.1 hypothetical protein F6X38_14225 [Aureimonas leprariae]